QKHLSRRKALIERELERILARGSGRLYEAMRYAVLGEGKRFRPLLVLSAAEALGADSALALPFACGIEFIHSYSLVHDDLPCMDDDDTRRGRPSCHKAFGEDIALLAGDALLTLAFEIMAGAEVPRRLGPAKTQILLEAARLAGVDGMIGGQWLDISYTADRSAGLEELMRKKTGALIVLAVRAGALVAGAEKAALAALTAYAQNVGLAFQIRDDLIDAAEAGRKPGLDKPNFAAAAGPEKARLALFELVSEARSALKRGRIDSPVLHRLAERLRAY
ncbi:MAG: polyprenyl synthetase family protein, partial [Candidatus Aminicenantales bacterium]